MTARREAIGRIVGTLVVIVVVLVGVLAVTTFSQTSVTHTMSNTSISVITSTYTTTTTSQQLVTQTVTGTTTLIQTTTVISQRNETVTTTATQTTTVLTTMSFAYLATGLCYVNQSPAPCWGTPVFTFNCLSEALTSQGCTQNVTSTLSPYPTYAINIKYPILNQTGELPWANCLWNLLGATPEHEYAYCYVLNSTAFIIGEPAITGYE